MNSTNTTGGNGEAVATSAELAGGDLHGKIMNLPCVLGKNVVTRQWRDGYKLGHRDARHAAAELAAATQARVHELEKALAYWLPVTEPLQHKHDAPSTEHRRRWREARAALGNVEPGNTKLTGAE